MTVVVVGVVAVMVKGVAGVPQRSFVWSANNRQLFLQVQFICFKWPSRSIYLVCNNSLVSK